MLIVRTINILKAEALEKTHNLSFRPEFSSAEIVIQDYQFIILNLVIVMDSRRNIAKLKGESFIAIFDRLDPDAVLSCWLFLMRVGLRHASMGLLKDGLSGWCFRMVVVAIVVV